MSAAEHVESLKAKHQDLEHLILEEEGRPHPDQALITQLKRQKLRIKDEIAHLAHAEPTAARVFPGGRGPGSTFRVELLGPGGVVSPRRRPGPIHPLACWF